LAALDPSSLAPISTIALAKSADFVVTSQLRRALDSAKVMGVTVQYSDALFNEADIPNVNIPFFKFRAKTWLVVLRILMLLRLGQSDSSFKASKLQAKKAAEKLILLSTSYNHIVLVGHGGMNWMIRKELLKMGWNLENKGSHSNWGASVLNIS
jgi:broad specificity phosphatase PhoE